MRIRSFFSQQQKWTEAMLRCASVAAMQYVLPSPCVKFKAQPHSYCSSSCVCMCQLSISVDFNATWTESYFFGLFISGEREKELQTAEERRRRKWRRRKCWFEEILMLTELHKAQSACSSRGTHMLPERARAFARETRQPVDCWALQWASLCACA